MNTWIKCLQASECLGSQSTLIILALWLSQLPLYTHTKKLKLYTNMVLSDSFIFIGLNDLNDATQRDVLCGCDSQKLIHRFSLFSLYWLQTDSTPQKCCWNLNFVYSFFWYWHFSVCTFLFLTLFNLLFLFDKSVYLENSEYFADQERIIKRMNVYWGQM